MARAELWPPAGRAVITHALLCTPRTPQRAVLSCAGARTIMPPHKKSWRAENYSPRGLTGEGFEAETQMMGLVPREVYFKLDDKNTVTV